MQIQLSISTVAGVFVADWSTRVTSCHVRTGIHGYESCEVELQLPFMEAFLYYQQLGPLKLRVSWGSFRVWEGRLEDPTQFAETVSGLRIVALGAWVAFSDSPYTALWSDSKYDDWVIVDGTEAPAIGAGATKEKYAIDVQNRIFVGLQKGTIYTNGLDYAIVSKKIPHLSTRNIIGISFDLSTNLPNNWQILVTTRNVDYTGGANVLTFTCTGALLNRSFNLTFAGNVLIDFLVFNNTGGNYTMVGENATLYALITNVRVVTATTNRINTTLGTNIAAGTRTVTPGSMARIFVGQRLFIAQNTATSESVVVTAITATTFTAVFANAHITTDTVTAHVVYPDEIMKDCVSTLNVLNSNQVASGVDLIQSQAVDLDQAIYEDQLPSEIIAELLEKSDNQTTPRQWIAMVYNDQQLIVRPRGSGNAWYTDITTLEVVRTLTQLFNSVYAIYKDASNKRNLRTATSTNADSVTKFGITRRKAIAVDTTDATQAAKIRDSVLALQLDPIPRARVEIDRIFDKYGNPFPLFYMRADDTLTIRNLPPVLSTTLYDKIRTLVITRTDVDLIKSSITLELEIPMPDVAVQLTRALNSKG